MFLLCLSLGFTTPIPNRPEKKSLTGDIVFGNNHREQEWDVGQVYRDGRKASKV